MFVKPDNWNELSPLEKRKLRLDHWQNAPVEFISPEAEANYPYCEAVLINCALAGIRPEGWGEVGGDTSNVHYWEYTSTNISDGRPVDVSQRRPFSRQLTQEQDAEIIADYGDPTYVLGGWTPSMAPLILSQPAAAIAEVG